MCIIAIQPKGKKISRKTLQNCWNNNEDGAGIMYSFNGEIIVKKELSSFDKFMEYKHDADKLNVNIIMHFRISTSGGINLLNCHPFKVNSSLYFCHNGVLDIKVPSGSEINDTQIYNNTILRNLPKGWQRNNAVMQLVKHSIGNRNKFALLDAEGNYYIINEEAGQWENGCWFSNSTFSYSYNNIVSSNYYTKSKKVKGFKTYSYFYGWEEETIKETKLTQLCQCCNSSKALDEIVYSKYWDTYLCEECEKTFV